MQHVDEAEPAGDVHRGRHSCGLGHPRHPHRTDHAAVVVQVGLHDVHGAIGDHPPEPPVAVLLLAAGHGDGQRVGHDLGVFEVIERAGLLEVDSLDLFEHPAHTNRLRRIVGAV